MRLSPIATKAHPGFTLVELIIVIAIILAMAALLLSAVFRAVTVADELKNTNDIRQLDLAVQAFLTKYQLPYLPSQITLSKLGADSTGANPNQLNTSLNASGQPNNQLEYDSFQYLTRVWPRLSFASAVNWDGNTQTTTNKWTLQGQECLVFFLGGIPGNIPAAAGGVNQCLGFSTNPANPADLTRPMNPPFYDFKTERLALGQSTKAFHYLDAYGSSNNLTASKPYLYFSSYKTANGYNRYGSPSPDCAAFSVAAYGAGSLFQNPNTFQIISAGKDQGFGTTTNPWTPATASDVYPTSGTRNNPTGYDDQANFYNRLLGVPTP
jgi:prepilin-type N-terminal cleavage/methylation domain-containing protein